MSDAKSKAPAFQFYVDDWKGSRSVQRMTFAQRGMYLEMLIEQWDNCGEGLPDHPDVCADLLGGTPEEWRAAWPVLRRKFVDRRSKARTGEPEIHQLDDFDASRRIINARLEKTRAEHRRYKRGVSKGGQTRAATATRTERGTYAKVETPAAHQPSWKAAGEPHQLVSSTPTPTSSSTPPPKKHLDREGHLKRIASDLLEQYPTVYAKVRAGASYHTSHLTFERDFDNCYALAESYPNTGQLLAMLEVFLGRDMGDKNRPGTPGQFRHMAPECDEVLRRSGWKATA